MHKNYHTLASCTMASRASSLAGCCIASTHAATSHLLVSLPLIMPLLLIPPWPPMPLVWLVVASPLLMPPPPIYWPLCYSLLLRGLNVALLPPALSLSGLLSGR